MKSSKYDIVLPITITTLMAIIGVTFVTFLKDPSLSEVSKNSVVLVEIAGFAILLSSILVIHIFKKTDKEKKQQVIADNIESENCEKMDADSTPEPNQEEPTDNEQQPIPKVNSEDNKIIIDIQDIHTAFLKSEERITIELKHVVTRANVNLIIGSVMAVVGIVILFWFVIEISKLDLQNWKLLNAFLPRLSIVLFVELFSYFFLNLYRDGIERIKYYQNELTNIESRKIAILACVAIEDSSTHKNIVMENLLKVERNHTFKKGETSLELEKIKRQGAFNKMIFDALKELGLTLKVKE